MKTQKKASSVAAFLILSLSVLNACGAEEKTADGQPETEGDTAAVTENVSVRDLYFRSDLPDTDWGGKAFRVLGQVNPANPQFSNFEIYAEQETGEPVNDAVFRRNSAIQEKYNVIITQSMSEVPADELHKIISAGDDLYDLAFLELKAAGTPIQHGYFYDLYDVGYLDFSKPWWNQEVNRMISVENRLFMTSSDFSLRDKNRAYTLFYNADMAAQLDIPDLVQTVRDGTWTLEKLENYNRLAASDVNGDGRMDLSDTYGLTMDSCHAFAALVIGGNNRIITKDAGDHLRITMNNQHMADTIDRVMDAACQPDTAFFCEDFQDYSASAVSFDEGRALFSTLFPHSLKRRAAVCEFVYGVLPMPKFDETQDQYYTLADVYGMLFGIPSSCENADFSGFMLEALSAASTDTTLQAYYDISCKTKYAVNKETGEMLDLIFDGILYDPSTLYGNFGLYDILYKIGYQRENTFASLYQKKEKSALKKMEKLTEAIQTIDTKG